MKQWSYSPHTSKVDGQAWIVAMEGLSALTENNPHKNDKLDHKGKLIYQTVLFQNNNSWCRDYIFEESISRG
jgi:hypothetical protein